MPPSPAAYSALCVGLSTTGPIGLNRLSTMLPAVVHRHDQSQAGSSQKAWLQVAHMVRSTTLQGLEHVGQIEDLGKIINLASMPTNYQVGPGLASYQEAVDNLAKGLRVKPEMMQRSCIETRSLETADTRSGCLCSHHGDQGITYKMVGWERCAKCESVNIASGSPI